MLPLHKKKRKAKCIYLYLLELPKFFFGRMHTQKLIKVIKQVEGERKMEHTWYARWSMHLIAYIFTLFRDAHFLKLQVGEGKL